MQDKKLNKIVYIQYIVSYKKEMLLFYEKKSRELLANVDIYGLDADAAADLCSRKLDSVTARYTECAHIQVNSYDRSTFLLKVRKLGFANSKILHNYLLDNLGRDYNRNFIIHKDKLKSGKHGAYTMFRIVPKTRIYRIQQVLHKMGIKKTYFEQEDNFLTPKAAKTANRRNGFVILEKPGCSVVNVVMNGMVTKSFVVDHKSTRISKYNTQFSSLKNLITALYLESQSECEEIPLTVINFYGRKETFDKLQDGVNVGLKLNYLGDNTPFLLNFSKPFTASYQTFKEIREKRRKYPSGLRRGFTIIEAVVAFTVFAIVAGALTVFISNSVNSNANLKMRTLANNYVNNVSEIFEADPSASTVNRLTAHTGEDFSSTVLYYLDAQMDYDRPSTSSNSMKYAVSYSYSVVTATNPQNFTKYILTINSLSVLDGGRLVINQPKEMIVVK